MDAVYLSIGVGFFTLMALIVARACERVKP